MSFTFIGSRKTVSERENRTLASVPDFNNIEITEFPRKIEGFVDDHFGGREIFVDFLRTVKFKIFKKPLTDDILKGKEDWYFKSRAVYDEVNKKREFGQFDTLADDLNKVHKYLKKHNKELYLFLIPAKFYIYPEYLPSWIDVDNKFRQTPNIFIETLRRKTSIKTVDLYPVMIDAKKTGDRLFWKADSHWNPYGASIAVRYMFEYLESKRNYEIPYQETDWWTFSKITDLYKMMGFIDKREVGKGPSPAKIDFTERLPFSISYYDKMKMAKDWREFKRYDVVTSKAGKETPAIFCDSYLTGGNCNHILQKSFKTSYIGHYRDMIPSLLYMIKNNIEFDYVVIAFVDRNIHEFERDILKDSVRIPAD